MFSDTENVVRSVLTMRQCPTILRTILVLAMIPLTLWSGRISPGCICADGHFEAHCGGGSCCSTSAKSADSGKCACQSCCRSHVASHKSCCPATRDSGEVGTPEKPCGNNGCCHPLTLSPIVAEETSPLPDGTDVPAFTDSVVLVLLPPVVKQNIVVHLMDSGPQRDRLSLIQSFLI